MNSFTFGCTENENGLISGKTRPSGTPVPKYYGGHRIDTQSTKNLLMIFFFFSLINIFFFLEKNGHQKIVVGILSGRRPNTDRQGPLKLQGHRWVIDTPHPLGNCVIGFYHGNFKSLVTHEEFPFVVTISLT